jgi:hypothetical protein
VQPTSPTPDQPIPAPAAEKPVSISRLWEIASRNPVMPVLGYKPFI